MEKKLQNRGDLTRRHKLPVLTDSKAQLHSLMPHLPELTASTDRLKDLRKLYFQYKSNAQILANSPYFTNRNQQKQVIALINSAKHDLDHRKTEEITSQFGMGAHALAGLERRERVEVRVRMMVMGHVVEVDKEARSVEELEHLLKI